MSLTYKGFNYVSYYNGAYENADSLPALVGTNANSVALALQYGIDVQNSAVYADAAYTDRMAALAATIVEAKGHGLSVMVRPRRSWKEKSSPSSCRIPMGIGRINRP
jgi:hypothetical protein